MCDAGLPTFNTPGMSLVGGLAGTDRMGFLLSWLRSPTAPFAGYRYQLRQTGAAILPVHLQAALNMVRIPGKDGTDDCIVFFHRKMEVVDDGTGIESPVAFGLRLDGCMEREESRPRARVDDGLVEGAIKIENSLR